MAMDIKVLLLDDEPLVQMILRAKLERAGALVLEARNCTDALELAQQTDFDVGIFDHCLPDGNGDELVRTLVGSGIVFPIIMLSGDAVDVNVADLKNICAVLPKPPDATAIVQAVADAVGCRLEREVVRVGRYAYCKIEADSEIPAECIRDEWLAVDFTGFSGESVPPAVIKVLSCDRSGTAVVGAGEALLKQLRAKDIDCCFVADTEELAALSRHPAQPSERSAVLSVIVE